MADDYQDPWDPGGPSWNEHVQKVVELVQLTPLRPADHVRMAREVGAALERRDEEEDA